MLTSFLTSLAAWMRTHSVEFSRWSICIVYFWFGTLKLIGASPAEPLVEELFEQTLGWLMPFAFFYAVFAVFEMAIGVMILRQRFDRISASFIGLHLITTIMPLFVLTTTTWSGFLVPTLIGQYIIKNVLIIAAVATILAGGSTKSNPSDRP